jgi:DNA-binding NarL/FixJ family response regulator
MTMSGGRPPIRVLIADDQRVVRDGLAMLVGLIDGVEVTGAACDGAEAVRLAMAQRPDVILMDLRMPGTDGSPPPRSSASTSPPPGCSC